MKTRYKTAVTRISYGSVFSDFYSVKFHLIQQLSNKWVKQFFAFSQLFSATLINIFPELNHTLPIGIAVPL